MKIENAIASCSCQQKAIDYYLGTYFLILLIIRNALLGVPCTIDSALENRFSLCHFFMSLANREILNETASS